MGRNNKRRRAQAAEKSVWVTDPSNPMYVACRACGFRVEAVRAVVTGWSATEHLGLRYNFCPHCGRPMFVPSPDGTAP